MFFWGNELFDNVTCLFVFGPILDLLMIGNCFVIHLLIQMYNTFRHSQLINQIFSNIFYLVLFII